jgi:hypothetical protein
MGENCIFIQVLLPKGRLEGSPRFCQPVFFLNEARSAQRSARAPAAIIVDALGKPWMIFSFLEEGGERDAWESEANDRPGPPGTFRTSELVVVKAFRSSR